MITIHGETDFAPYKESVISYVESKIKEEPSYHSFDMISMIQIPVGSIIKTPEFSTSSLMTRRMLCRYGFNHEGGLGMKAQRIKEPIIPFSTRKRYGVGYGAINNHHGGRDQSRENHKGRGSQGD